jgi:hypothetical protein
VDPGGRTGTWRDRARATRLALPSRLSPALVRACLSGDMETGDQEDRRAVFYGDIRVTSDRRKGTCLFWVRRCIRRNRGTQVSYLRACMRAQVVPDVAPGFNVPAFYEDFVMERRQYVDDLLARQQHRREQRRAAGGPPAATQTRAA